MPMNNRKKVVKMPVGMLRSFWAPIATEPDAALPTYGDVEEMGAARLGTLTVTTAVSDIYGDDVDLVHFEDFVSYQFVGETTLDDLTVNAKIYGHTEADGLVSSAAGDQAPYGGYGFVEPILNTNKSVVYRATFLVKLSANAANEAQNAATRQGSAEPRANSITYTGFACKNGEWRKQKEFSSEADAVNWLLALFGATASWNVTTVIVGSGSVSPSGSNAYAAGSNAVLTFTADPSALYDNGTDVTASISSHKYTISAIAADHQIVAIWSA